MNTAHYATISYCCHLCTGFQDSRPSTMINAQDGLTRHQSFHLGCVNSRKQVFTGSHTGVLGQSIVQAPRATERAATPEALTRSPLD